MVLRAFGVPLGLLFGALEGVLALLLDVEIDPEALIAIGSATSSALFGLVLSFLAAEDSLDGVLELLELLIGAPGRLLGPFWGP